MMTLEKLRDLKKKRLKWQAIWAVFFMTATITPIAMNWNPSTSLQSVMQILTIVLIGSVAAFAEYFEIKKAARSSK